jgi:CRP-like cAMP-binding protein
LSKGVSTVTLNPLVRKLENTFLLTEAEHAAVRRVPVRVTDLKADQDIVREGDRPTRSCFVLKGITYSYKFAAAGKRQILSFHIAGDAPDLQSLHLPVLDISIGSITACTIGFVEHEALHALCASSPRIAAALWRETLIESAIFREWMTSIGRRLAYPRVAHFLCEYYQRMNAVGLSDGQTMSFPLSQEEIGDALGLSTVHINRVLQALRAADAISLKNAVLKVLDWEKLQEIGEFDPTYLHLAIKKLNGVADPPDRAAARS